MSFPSGLAELNTTLEKLKEEERRLGEEREAARAILRQLEAQTRAHSNFVTAVQCLLSSWRDADPGKYGSAYFFVGQANDVWVVVREFLSEGTPVCTDRGEWRRYVDSRKWWGAPFDRIRPSLPVVPLDQVKTEACPLCGQVQPVVERYVQTYDSAEGDNWLAERLVFCTDCKAASPVAQPRNSSVRMR